MIRVSLSWHRNTQLGMLSFYLFY